MILKATAGAINATSTLSCKTSVFITFTSKKFSSLQIVIPNNTLLMQSKKWGFSFFEIVVKLKRLGPSPSLGGNLNSWGYLFSGKRYVISACDVYQVSDSSSWPCQQLCFPLVNYLSTTGQRWTSLILNHWGKQYFFHMISIFLMAVFSKNQLIINKSR